MNIQHTNERYFEEKDIWVMDSECCDRCGCILDEFDIDLCADCKQEAWDSTEHDSYDGWGSDWDIPILEITLPAFFQAASLFAKAAILESWYKE